VIHGERWVDRAMYALGWPHWDGDSPTSLHEVEHREDLTDEQRAGVLHGAADRFYRLS
jgi:predicted TIM-barrel fold metal-dependent hydrolase